MILAVKKLFLRSKYKKFFLKGRGRKIVKRNGRPKGIRRKAAAEKEEKAKCQFI